ncbi:MAG: hypothetical protein IKX95_09010, partial [Lachnospiraceae bacterium]|nr:hypothetical protein [Lachnospiraceae bacterium]
VALFFFVIVNVIGFLISVMSVNEEYYMISYGSRAHDMIANVIKGYADMFMGASILNIIFTIVLGALLGIGGFVYLDNRVKVDFYESMPQKRGSKYSVIWLSGLLIYAGSYIIGMLLNYGILVASGYGDVFSMAEAVRAFAILFTFFVGVYHLAILSVLLTGTLFISVCAFAALSLYELVVRWIIIMLKDDFFTYAHTIYDDYTPLLSPYGLLSLIMRDMADKFSIMPHMCMLIIFDLALLVLNYVLYHKRPLEAAGKTMVFRITRPVIKLLITVPVAVFVADIVYGILKDSSSGTLKATLFTVIVTVIAAILASALIQGIFEQDIRLAFKKKLNWFLCSAAALLIFFGFRGDLINLDRFVPTPSMVSSVAFYPQGYGNRYSAVTPELTTEDLEAFIRKNMYITDAAAMCDLAKLSIGRFDGEMDLLDEDEYPDTGLFETAIVYFRLKNGHTMSRVYQIPVKDEEAIGLIGRIMDTKEFRYGFYDFDKYDLEAAVRETKLTDLNARYTDGVWSESFTPDEILEMIALYRQDLEECTYADKLDEYPEGHVILDIATKERWGGCYEYDLAIYPCMKNSMGYIKGKGYDRSTMELRDQIVGITVTNYHNDEVDEYYNSLPEGEDPDYEYVDSLTKVQYYYDDADIDKLL